MPRMRVDVTNWLIPHLGYGEYRYSNTIRPSVDMEVRLYLQRHMNHRVKRQSEQGMKKARHLSHTSSSWINDEKLQFSMLVIG